MLLLPNLPAGLTHLDIALTAQPLSLLGFPATNPAASLALHHYCPAVEIHHLSSASGLRLCVSSPVLLTYSLPIAFEHLLCYSRWCDTRRSYYISTHRGGNPGLNIILYVNPLTVPI